MPRIARVFPRKTNMTPQDKDSYIGLPDFFTPQYDIVNISVTFTWDISLAKELKRQWKEKTTVINIGGCAFDDPGGNFISGFYLKKGVVITSRGCPNNCPWCFVPRREGKIRELPIVEGHIVQDNNLLACSKNHIDRVFQMLSHQGSVDFSGGFEAEKITDSIIERLRSLKIKQIWLAYDCPADLKPLRTATIKLTKYFNRNQLRCYVLIGYQNDTIEKAENRLKVAWELGCLPFAMLYINERGQSKTSLLWKKLQRKWCRPAIIKSLMKQGTEVKDAQKGGESEKIDG